MGSNWMRATLMIQHPGVYELLFIVDDVYLPNFPIRIKAQASNLDNEKDVFVQFTNKNNLFVGKVLELYTNIEITLKSSIRFKGNFYKLYFPSVLLLFSSNSFIYLFIYN